VNAIITRKQEHSRKPDEQYEIIRNCSPAPYLELFARKRTEGWTSWGNQAETYEEARPIIPGYTTHVLHGRRGANGAPSANGTHLGPKKRRRPRKKRPDESNGLFPF
jgi:hypothetical protein